MGGPAARLLPCGTQGLVLSSRSMSGVLLARGPWEQTGGGAATGDGQLGLCGRELQGSCRHSGPEGTASWPLKLLPGQGSLPQGVLA